MFRRLVSTDSTDVLGMTHLKVTTSDRDYGCANDLMIETTKGLSSGDNECSNVGKARTRRVGLLKGLTHREYSLSTDDRRRNAKFPANVEVATVTDELSRRSPPFRSELG